MATPRYGPMARRIWLAALRARGRQRALALLCALPGQALWVRLLAWLPRLLAHLPRAWRGPDYGLCLQNLEWLGFEPGPARALACRYTAIQLQHQVHQQHYPRDCPLALRAWTESIPWLDPDRHWPRTLHRATLIVLCHSGEHWMAVASLIARRPTPTRFIIPIASYADPYTRAALKSLECLGHPLEVLDSHDPNTALSIARGLRRGHQVMIFADLPVGFGAQRFGEPVEGRFFGRAAQFVKGPMFFAARLNCAVLMVGHRAEPGSRGRLEMIRWIDPGSRDAMQQQWSEALEGFIRSAPENWLYLPRMEAFFHGQRRRAATSGLPPALQGRAVVGR